MVTLNWFNTTEIDQFARDLAQDLIGRLPPLPDARKKATPERLRNTREALIVRASAFARGHNVNWYKKAHFGNTFKWELRSAGYDQSFTDALTYDVLLAIASGKAKV